MIEVADETWAPLLGAYGDGGFFDLVKRMADKRRATGKTAPFKLVIEYGSDRGLGGTTIWNEKNGDMPIALSPPRDQREADFKLRHLENYVK